MGLVWREQLSVGNNIIDDDHKYLIDLINRIEGCLGDGTNEEVLTEQLDKLAQYAQIHFAREERIAASAGYAKVPQLHASHDVLLDDLNTIKQELLGARTPEITERLTTFLRNWLINHVIKEDLLMAPALRKFAPTFEPR